MSWNKTIGNGIASMSSKARFGWSKGGAGLLERPTFDQSQFDPTPQAKEGDKGQLRDKKGAFSGDRYKVFPSDNIYLKSSQRTLSLLEQCLTRRNIKQIQSHLIVSGTLFDPFAAGKLIAFYAISKHGDLSHAYLLFCHLPHPTKFIWNTMIRAFAEKQEPIKAIALYKKMLEKRILPNNYTFSFLLKASVDLTDVLFGLQIHAQIIKLGWESYDFVQNGLIHLYATCNCVALARKLFDMSLNLDVISWTAMINGYAKSGELEVARRLFNEMPERNAVSWSSLISGYAQVGMFREALELFNEMQLAGIQPNHAGIVGALLACAFLGALDQGRWIHAYVNRNGMELDTILGTSLIDMYAKCGCIDTALQVFNEMPERDVFAFTSMISGLANHGQSASAIMLFCKMQKEGVEPNEVTFICVLSACSRMGLVEEGMRFFKSMSATYGIDPGVEHYGCLVDLLGRAGLLEEAKRVVREMPMDPDSYVLGALLNACRMHGDVELGKEMVESLSRRSLDHGGVHVLLSNMFASANQWEDVAKVRKGMEEKKVKKVPGCSLIEVDGVIWEFVVGDRSHFIIEEVIFLLLGMDKQLKSFGLDDNFMSIEQFL
ncbi:pentatricopeptide repeat-containing protein At5g66520-like [Macadamia integrifolia]|uniref:pentatricopeptide repeat-containing protein At5g66520-like n=1 Tax=Macadamia integrifolia TaxID=60698 RepID=UPI001C4F3D21|nr:pentatricopeptide repeat-containing protein At5g66520-like [Macadamia integrifolia]XP_042500344.1 pentatricopeptide repeat-containing protein At5g66520-like [Macadamia integrifolia]